MLIVYRLGTFIPVPGIDAGALQDFVDQAQTGITGILSMFTGGAISRMAIFALGIMPYISASIIVQLLTAMVPALEQLKKEGEQGRKKINQYTRYGTVALAFFQAYGLSAGLQAGDLATNPGFLTFQLPAIITLVGGTMFLMWIGEQITARGIGNGISLIIFVGIVAELPAALAQFFVQGRSGVISPPVILGVMVMVVAVIAFRRYPTDLRICLVVVANNDQHILWIANIWLHVYVACLVWPRPTAVLCVLRSDDRIFQLLLHRERIVQNR